MLTHRTRTIFAHLMLGVGAAGVLATGADHLYEYTATGFSTIPTIGTLFLLNFIAATIVGAGLLLPLRRMTERFADPVRTLLALSVNGHRVLPNGGHEFPHWWPSFLPTGGHESPHQQIG
jgi:hypothetical protein